MGVHDDDVEQMRLRVLSWRDRFLDYYEEAQFRVARHLPSGGAVSVALVVLVFVVVGVFFAFDGRLPVLVGVGVSVGLAGGSVVAGYLASRVEPPEEDTSARDSDLRELIAAYARDGEGGDGDLLAETVDLDPGSRDARFGAFLRAIAWLHLPWIVVYSIGVVMPLVAVLPIGAQTQQVAIGCTVMPLLVAASLTAWAVWSRAIIRSAIRAGVRPARVLTSPIAAVGMTFLTLSSVWGLVGASPWGSGGAGEVAEVSNGGEDASQGRRDLIEDAIDETVNP